jgi:hypothetical protein
VGIDSSSSNGRWQCWYSTPSANVTAVCSEQVSLPRPLVTGEEAMKPRGVKPVVEKPPVMISSAGDPEDASSPEDRGLKISRQ